MYRTPQTPNAIAIAIPMICHGSKTGKTDRRLVKLDVTAGTGVLGEVVALPLLEVDAVVPFAAVLGFAGGVDADEDEARLTDPEVLVMDWVVVLVCVFEVVPRLQLEAGLALLVVLEVDMDSGAPISGPLYTETNGISQEIHRLQKLSKCLQYFKIFVNVGRALLPRYIDRGDATASTQPRESSYRSATTFMPDSFSLPH